VFEGPVQDLIDELGKLPGIGPKSAQRIAFHLLSVEPPDIDRLTAALGRLYGGGGFGAAARAHGKAGKNEQRTELK
jgi:recombination protein RecR